MYAATIRKVIGDPAWWPPHTYEQGLMWAYEYIAIFILGVVLVIGLILYALYRDINKKQPEKVVTPPIEAQAEPRQSVIN